MEENKRECVVRLHWAYIQQQHLHSLQKKQNKYEEAKAQKKKKTLVVEENKRECVVRLHWAYIQQDYLDLQNKSGRKNEKAKAKKHWLWKRIKEESA